ncbi:MAG: hypothetical protein LAO31_06630 [Acidobacteriia bacterium]|nr:hypothetical protein [Terriglobia bacterium]
MTDSEDEGRTLLLTGSGVLKGREIIQAKETLIAQQEQVRRITRAMFLLAVVAPKDYMFGLARTWEALVDSAGWQTAVFQTRLDAEACLQTIQPASG